MTSNKIDIKEVGAIEFDDKQLLIRVLSKQAYLMWEHRYPNQPAYIQAQRKILKKFELELLRRSKAN